MVAKVVECLLLMDQNPVSRALSFATGSLHHPTIINRYPMKCSAQTTAGPCGQPVKPGSRHCRRHTREHELTTAYRISDPLLQDSVDHQSRQSLLDIGHQIVLLRSIVERRLNMAGDTEAEQISAFNFVAVQLAALTKMSETLIKLSKESGSLMERAEVEAYTDSILGIVIEEIKTLHGFEAVVDRIVARIAELEDTDGN